MARLMDEPPGAGGDVSEWNHPRRRRVPANARAGCSRGPQTLARRHFRSGTQPWFRTETLSAASGFHAASRPFLPPGAACANVLAW